MKDGILDYDEFKARNDCWEKSLIPKNEKMSFDIGFAAACHFYRPIQIELSLSLAAQADRISDLEGEREVFQKAFVKIAAAMKDRLPDSDFQMAILDAMQEIAIREIIREAKGKEQI